ncbi:MAG TPA: PD-(D/E)XK nuclease family protein [Steroidobacteraceae bacterium]|nr:PD-(D/E)XK nuclease family protein [Steroidobacteraceae bacterium]
MPSRQRAHALRLAYAGAQLAQGRRVWSSPDTLPLEGWLAREVERCAANRGGLPRLLSPAEEWLLWRQCTAEATEGLDLINRASLAESLRRASGLAAELGVDLRAVREPPGTEGALLVAVHQAVAERCRALGAALLPDVLSLLPCVGDQRPLVFAGFLAPSPRLRAIAGVRAQHGYETLPSQPDPAAAGHVRVARPADAMEELERIAAWCCQRLRARGDDRILIVLPGSSGRRERLATLIRQAIDPRGWLSTHAAQAQVDWVGEIEAASPVIIEGGQPLASLPAVAHALASLSLLAGESLEIERLAEWLRAPAWAEPDPAARARLDLWLRQGVRLQLDLPALLALLRRAPLPISEPARVIVTRLERAMDALAAGSGTPREWSERFKAALDVLGWPGAPGQRASAEQQTLVRFHELLEELGQLSAAARSMTRDVALQWLTELAAHTPYRPADDDAPVTLSSSYMDPVVQYDAVWVGGLNAESFPQPVAPDPFVPLAAQVAAGSPAATAAGRLEEARALVAAWRTASGELVLSAPARDGDIELLPSPLLEEWRSAAEPAAEERGPVWLPARLHRPARVVEWRDDVGVVWNEGQRLPSGTRSLELQNNCPFRAYAELRLGSIELDAPEPGIAPDARGQLLHSVLQKLWDRLGDSRALAALTPEALDELLSACIDGAMSELDPGGDEPLAVPALARERRRTARLVRKLLELERARAPFRVQSTEYESRLRLADQELRLRIDRLDALESGGVAILDYKSGRRVSADWYGERPSHPQLLAYLAAVGEGVVAMATINVTAREVRFDGISATEKLLPRVAGVKGPEGRSEDAWQTRVSEWRTVVERLARDFAAGRASVDPMPRACDYCHVASVCRVGDDIVVDEGAEDAALGMDDDD